MIALYRVSDGRIHATVLSTLAKEHAQRRRDFRIRLYGAQQCREKSLAYVELRLEAHVLDVPLPLGADSLPILSRLGEVLSEARQPD